jgi:hypothetical protein
MVLHYNFDLKVTIKSWEDFFRVSAPWDICSWIWNKFKFKPRRERRFFGGFSLVVKS